MKLLLYQYINDFWRSVVPRKPKWEIIDYNQRVTVTP